MQKFILFALIGFAAQAQANYALSQNGKVVKCYADDDISVTVYAKRTSMKYKIEGESNGVLKITDTKTDGKTYVTYTTEEYSLTLSDAGDTFKFNDQDDVATMDCE